MLKKTGAEITKAAVAGPVVDPDKMTSEQLDQLVADEGIVDDLPAEWPTWAADQKSTWLQSMFGDSAGGEIEVSKTSPFNDGDTDAGAAAAAGFAQKAEIAEVVKTADAVIEAAKPKKAPKKAKGTSVGAPTTVAKDGEIVKADPIIEMVHEIENMKEQAVYDEIAKVIEQSEVAYFKLGGLLAVSLTNSWFNGYASFKEMIEGKFGFKYRKAMYLVEVYTKVVESGVAWAKLEPVGWTKVQIIAKVLTAENADKWIEIAKAQNAPTLANVVDLEIKKIAGLASGDETVKSVTNMHFKVHADQKATIDAALEKSKENQRHRGRRGRAHQRLPRLPGRRDLRAADCGDRPGRYRGGAQAGVRRK